jgi:hypothetical protein
MLTLISDRVADLSEEVRMLKRRVDDIEDECDQSDVVEEVLKKVETIEGLHLAPSFVGQFTYTNVAGVARQIHITEPKLTGRIRRGIIISVSAKVLNPSDRGSMSFTTSKLSWNVRENEITVDLSPVYSNILRGTFVEMLVVDVLSASGDRRSTSFLLLRTPSGSAADAASSLIGAAVDST